MPRYRLTIAYDGTDFCGWQKQEPPADGPTAPPPGAPDPTLPASWFAPPEGRSPLRTVQAVVEHAVRLAVREPVVLTGASRTDSGVHARGQVGAFTCSDGSEPDTRAGGWPESRGGDRLLMAVNSRLPGDVAVVDARAVHASFNPIADALRKCYSYTIFSGRDRPLFDRRQVFHFRGTLDPRRMAEAARRVEGEHDFASFAAAGHGRASTVRTVHDCRVTRVDERRTRIEIVGNGFLYNMVRIIAGTLIEIGSGRRDASSIPRALAARDRRTAGPTAPPEGLCLEWIEYSESLPQETQKHKEEDLGDQK